MKIESLKNLETPISHRASAPSFTVTTILVALFAGLVLCDSVRAQTQTPTAVSPISLTNFGAYNQNFNTDEAAPEGPGLAAGTTDTLTSTPIPPGWGYVESGSSANTTYRVANGTATTGDTYSYGSSTGGSTLTNVERAFGERTNALLQSQLGSQFTNNTGSTITSLIISYTGEQWRSGTATADQLDFKYNATNSVVGSLTAGTFVDFNTLDFAAIQNGTDASLDGNNAANQATPSGTITGLSIANGDTFTIRWDSINSQTTATDAGLAIDNFSLTPTPEPATVVSGVFALCGLCFHQRRRLIRALRPRSV